MFACIVSFIVKKGWLIKNNRTVTIGYSCSIKFSFILTLIWLDNGWISQMSKKLIVN